jgi:hypothetical protein
MVIALSEYTPHARWSRFNDFFSLARRCIRARLQKRVVPGLLETKET